MLPLSAESGRVYSWGRNNRGQTGQGHLRDVQRPTVLDFFSPEDGVVSVSCGSEESFAVTRSGSVYAWGAGKERPRVVAGIKEAIEKAQKEERAALERLMKSAANGLNGHGELKVNVEVSERPDRVVQVVSGNGHTLAVTAEGRLIVWGSNDHGQLGLGLDAASILSDGPGQEIHEAPSVFPPSPVLFFDPRVQRVAAVACGALHSIVVTDLGAVYGFGSDRFGQLGLGGTDRSDVFSPTEVRILFCFFVFIKFPVLQGSLVS